MSLRRGQSRALRGIERDLADSDPGLNASFLSFAAHAGRPLRVWCAQNWICTQAASDGIPLAGDLLFLVRADGRLNPVTQVGPPEPQAGDTMVLLGPPAGGS